MSQKDRTLTSADGSEVPTKWTERNLLDRLQVRHNQHGGNGPKWVFMEHVRSHSGFDVRATIDGLAMHLWQSKRHEVHAYEIKVSRSDFRRELVDDCYKSSVWREWVDYFWVVAPKDVVPLDELPDDWGLMVPHGPSVRVARRAKRLRLEPTWHGEAPQIDRTVVAAMLRAAAKLPDSPPLNPMSWEFCRSCGGSGWVGSRIEHEHPGCGHRCILCDPPPGYDRTYAKCPVSL